MRNFYERHLRKSKVEDVIRLAAWLGVQETDLEIIIQELILMGIVKRNPEDIFPRPLYYRKD